MAKKPARKEVRQTVGNISCDELDGTIKEAIERLQKLADAHGETAHLDYGQHDQWDDAYSYDIEIDRPETDSEYNERVNALKAQEANHERREREEYARLAKKYGGVK